MFKKRLLKAAFGESESAQETSPTKSEEAQIASIHAHIDSLNKVNEILLEQIKSLYAINQKAADSFINTQRYTLIILGIFSIICVIIAYNLGNETLKIIIASAGACGSFLVIWRVIRNNPLVAYRIATIDLISLSTIILGFFHQVMQIDLAISQLVLNPQSKEFGEINDMLNKIQIALAQTITELDQYAENLQEKEQ